MLLPRRPEQRVLFQPKADATVLLLSMRELSDLVAFCAVYEFEDLIAATTGADVVRPANLGHLELCRRLYKASHALRVVPSIRPAFDAITLPHDYDLFFPVFNHPYELYALHAVKEWRRRSRRAICFIGEVWEGSVPDYLVELLSDFDHVFLGMAGATAAVSRICGRPCSYLPLGVDALAFSPPAAGTLRSIDVCNIGRRSAVTHRALLDVSRARGLFYYFDTIKTAGAVPNAAKQLTFQVSRPSEHRELLANVLKRTRYFISNRARANEPGTRGEIAGRFYEGAAAGTIMIGEPPDCAEFREHFDWADAVIPVPFDAPEIQNVIDALESDHARVQRIQQANIVQALRRHDWVYRLRAVLERAHLAPTALMIEREARLQVVAERVLRSAWPAGGTFPEAPAAH